MRVFKKRYASGFCATMVSMAKMKKIVVANWKMNPPTLKEAEKLFNGIKKKVSKIAHVETVICPPFVYLLELALYYSGSKIKFGAQDVFWEEKGARTGEISALQLVSIGADYVIIGHSERRALGETNEEVNKKIKAALKAELRVIVCVGEQERNDNPSLTFKSSACSFVTLRFFAISPVNVSPAAASE